MKNSSAFSSLVRSAMQSAAPGYRFVDTSGGSGPLVTFARPTPKRPHLREHVVFQKGLRGADWYRVNLVPSFVGPGAGGVAWTHSLFEGKQLGPDVRFRDGEELAAQLDRTCKALEKSAKTFFAAYEKSYVRYEKLFGALVQHYVDWLTSSGKDLPASDFAMDDDGKVPAFSVWKASLRKKRLLGGMAGELETPLWRFWHGGRPMRREDYVKGDYYDCTACKSFTSFARGRLVKKKDAAFGEHYAFVCKKHR